MASSGYAVGWGALALINAGLAQGKGRPGALWFVISLFLGPVATLMIVVLPRIEIDPVTNTGGWRPRPFERLDWIVLGVFVALILATLILLAFPNLTRGSWV
ncbi:MAG TPA: hypothetical protein VF494_00190 [Candidatus Limnocylindrales bacterium]